MTKERKEELSMLSYGELIKLRDGIQEEIRKYEGIKNHGGRFGGGADDAAAADLYRRDLKDLAELIKYMADLYNEDVIIVDKTDPASMLRFAQGVFWNDETRQPNEADAQAAFAYMMELSEMGNADAMNILGAMYFEGRWVKKDEETAVKWYEKAADNGSSLAMCNAGYCYYYGNGVDIDYEKAYRYFSKSAMLGEWDSINKFGDMYRYGLYVPEDKITAFKIYADGYGKIPKNISVDAYPANLLRIGDCLLHGCGCVEDMAAAEKILTEAKGVFENQVKRGRPYAAPGLEKTEKLLKELGDKKQIKEWLEETE